MIVGGSKPQSAARCHLNARSMPTNGPYLGLRSNKRNAFSISSSERVHTSNVRSSHATISDHSWSLTLSDGGCACTFFSNCDFTCNCLTALAVGLLGRRKFSIVFRVCTTCGCECSSGLYHRSKLSTTSCMLQQTANRIPDTSIRPDGRNKDRAGNT